MNCDINTTTWAEKDICYTAGQEISNNGTYSVTDENGNPVDLSGVELEMQVKYKPKDPLSRVIIRLRTSDGTLTISGVDNNYVTMHGKYQVAAGDRYHDLFRFDTDEYIMKGVFRIYASGTRT
jgi:hypothetical protein